MDGRLPGQPTKASREADQTRSRPGFMSRLQSLAGFELERQDALAQKEVNRVSETKKASRRSTGYFGVAIWSPKFETNVGTLWRSSMVYGAAFVATVGGRRYRKQPSDVCNTSNHIPLQHYEDIHDLVQHLPSGCPIVGVELTQAATMLPRFNHPKQALYLLGAEDHGLPSGVLQHCHHLVQIPAERDWSMNVAVAGSVILYDRYIKQNGGFNGEF